MNYSSFNTRVRCSTCLKVIGVMSSNIQDNDIDILCKKCHIKERRKTTVQQEGNA